MDLRGIMRSELTAWVVGGGATLGVALVALAYLGWLGLGLVGLMGLVVSVRLRLHDGYAINDIGHGSGPVDLYARQIAETESHTRPEEKMAAAAEKAERSRGLYLVDTAFIAMAALGFGLFFLHGT